ncbi:hypothetical protein FRX31_006881, partial [Thalictrum thalictroides]
VANHNFNEAGSSGTKNALGQEINSPIRKNANSFNVLITVEEDINEDNVENNASEEDKTTEEELFWDEEPQHIAKTTSSEHQVPITGNIECSSPAQVTPLAIEGPPIQSSISGFQNTMDTFQNPAIQPAKQEALGTSSDPFFLTNGEEENSDSEDEGEDNTEDMAD